MHAAIGQRRVQQFVHRFGGFGAEPGKQPRPTTERPQRLGEQRMRRDVIDPRQQRREERPGRLPVRPLLRPRVQRLPQRGVPPDRQIREAVVRQSAERAGQQAGKGQVVLRQQQRIGERHQVLHRWLLGQHQPVQPGHRHTQRLQGAHQRAAEVVPATHQHHHVAGGERPAPALQHHATAQPRARSIAPSVSARICGARGQAAVLLRDRPWLRFLRIGERRERPQLHRAGVVRPVGVVCERIARIHHTGRRGRVCEHTIHQLQHRLRGAERHVQRRVLPGLACRAHALAQQSVRLVEGIDIGALERIDRLLAVADGEHGAVHVAGRRAGEELRGQRVRDAPLLGRGVLHLVQQQVIEAAVQLVQHPGRAGIDQKVGGAPDQVVVVEQPGRILVLRVGLQHRLCERHQRGGDRGHLQRQAGIVSRRRPGRIRRGTNAPDPDARRSPPWRRTGSVRAAFPPW